MKPFADFWPGLAALGFLALLALAIVVFAAALINIAFM
jgi:hypothetical protein